MKLREVKEFLKNHNFLRKYIYYQMKIKIETSIFNTDI